MGGGQEEFKGPFFILRKEKSFFWSILGIQDGTEVAQEVFYRPSPLVFKVIRFSALACSCEYNEDSMRIRGSVTAGLSNSVRPISVVVYFLPIMDR